MFPSKEQNTLPSGALKENGLRIREAEGCAEIREKVEEVGREFPGSHLPSCVLGEGGVVLSPRPNSTAFSSPSHALLSDSSAQHLSTSGKNV